MPKLSISVVTFNSERFIHDFCDSLKIQTFTDWELIVIDNNSTDRSPDLIRESFPKATISEQKKNLGFSRAHNLGIAWSRGEYVLVINTDIVLHPHCLEYLVRALDRDHRVACVGPKLLSWHRGSHTDPDVIDSAGLSLHRNYKVVDRFQGREDMPLEQEFVFGISGAFAMYRKKALDDVRIPRSRTRSVHEYFDEEFFAYKEDGDLSWRLTVRGWKNLFIPRAVAYHKRNVSGARSTWAYRKQRKTLNELSYRNHLAMIYKNHYWRVTLRYVPRILVFEIGKFIYLLFLDRSSIRGLWSFLRLYKRFHEKRKYVVSLRRISAKSFKKYVAQ